MIKMNSFKVNSSWKQLEVLKYRTAVFMSYLRCWSQGCLLNIKRILISGFPFVDCEVRGGPEDTGTDSVRARHPE